jgi:UDP-galactopyranose mutase
MSRWARERRVFFVEEPVFDSDTPRLSFDEVEPNLKVVVPHLQGGRPHEDTERPLRTLLDELVTDARVRDPILWMYTPMALGFSRHLRRSVTVYDCMDELTGFRGAPPILRELEHELFRTADLVFTGGHSLYEAKRPYHASVHAFPSSVDAAHFAKARRRDPREDPADQRDIPHPRLGFYGVIDERMDVELLQGIAERRPQHHYVVLGPVAKVDPAQLPQLPNLHFLGKKSYEQLPRYLAGWDVAIMPFALNEATRYISPTKTLEYLAAGKPVVSTPIHDVVRPYGEQGLVRIARDADEFVESVDAALAELGTSKFATRRASCDDFVAQTSWERTWAEMHSLVGHVLELRTKPEAQENPCSIISS